MLITSGIPNSYVGPSLQRSTINVNGKTSGIVSVPIDWSKYASENLKNGVSINLQGIIETVGSMYIDNRGFPLGLYVVFNDTGVSFYCGPDRQVSIPSLTAGKSFNVFLEAPLLNRASLPVANFETYCKNAVPVINICEAQSYVADYGSSDRSTIQLTQASYYINTTAPSNLVAPNNILYMEYLRVAITSAKPVAVGQCFFTLQITALGFSIYEISGRFQALSTDYVFLNMVDKIEPRTYIDGSNIQIKALTLVNIAPLVCSVSAHGKVIQ